jgi:hypothetical protein
VLVKHKQALVPEDGQCTGCVCVGKSDEVEDEHVKPFVLECVLLV